MSQSPTVCRREQCSPGGGVCRRARRCVGGAVKGLVSAHLVVVCVAEPDSVLAAAVLTWWWLCRWARQCVGGSSSHLVVVCVAGPDSVSARAVVPGAGVCSQLTHLSLAVAVVTQLALTPALELKTHSRTLQK